MKKAAKPPYQSLFLVFIYSISSILLMSCNNSNEKTKETTTTTTESKSAVAALTGTKTDTTVNGTATFTQEGEGKVKLVLDVTVPLLANHSVAVHIHEHGDCGDAGKNTHAHWNPTGKPHGKWGTGDFHSGDIGNVSLDASGKGSLTLETDLWNIGGNTNTDILNKAIIVHSGVDDYTSQPAGNAGSRIGCGVIEKK